MNYDALLLAADDLAARAHAGQVDKSGKDYIHHPRIVSSFCTSPKAKIVALLHDTIEDTNTTEDDLRPVFGDELTDAVLLMTHGDDEDYFTYIRRIKTNPIATEVKLADLKHNMDLSRIPNPTEKDFARIQKYEQAKKILEEKL